MDFVIAGSYDLLGGAFRVVGGVGLDVWFGVLPLVDFGGVSLAVAWLLNGGF